MRGATSATVLPTRALPSGVKKPRSSAATAVVAGFGAAEEDPVVAILPQAYNAEYFSPLNSAGVSIPQTLA
jgi:hypothetical protein